MYDGETHTKNYLDAVVDVVEHFAGFGDRLTERHTSTKTHINTHKHTRNEKTMPNE